MDDNSDYRNSVFEAVSAFLDGNIFTSGLRKPPSVAGHRKVGHSAAGRPVRLLQHQLTGVRLLWCVLGVLGVCVADAGRAAGTRAKRHDRFSNTLDNSGSRAEV